MVSPAKSGRSYRLTFALTVLTAAIFLPAVALAADEVSLNLVAADAEFLSNLPAGDNPAAVCVIGTGYNAADVPNANVVAGVNVSGRGELNDLSDNSSDSYGTHLVQMVSQTWQPVPIAVVKASEEKTPLEDINYREAVNSCSALETSGVISNLAVVVLSLPAIGTLPSDLPLLSERVGDLNIAGDLAVAGVGDDAGIVAMPAGIDDVIGVGGTDILSSTGGICPTSNSGTGLDLIAPGCGIEVLDASGENTGVEGSDYAAGFVAATAAALFSYSGTDASLADVENALVSTGVDTGSGITVSVEELFNAFGLDEVVGLYTPGVVTVPPFESTPVEVPPATNNVAALPTHTETTLPPTTIVRVLSFDKPALKRRWWHGYNLYMKLKEIPDGATVVVRYSGRIKRFKAGSVKKKTLKIRSRRKRLRIRIYFQSSAVGLGPALKLTVNRRR